jgi:hypothetical protein
LRWCKVQSPRLPAARLHQPVLSGAESAKL